MMQDIYNNFVAQYKLDYKGHFKDEYEGQNKLSRMANIFAIQNTVKLWRTL